MNSTIPITILLVDDHPIFRKGLHLLFEGEKDMRVVGEAADGYEAIEQTRELTPDIVVMDITMPNLNGVDATRQITSDFPETKVVALSIHSGKRFVEDMLRAGAMGYLLKETVPEEMVNGVRAVMGGQVYLSESITGVVVSQYRAALSQSQSGDENSELTEKDNNIIFLLVEGNSVKEISTILQISPQTVKSARRRIMENLDVNSVAELSESIRNEGLPARGYQTSSSGRVLTGPLILTKLHRPQIPPDHIHRTHLLNRLDQNRQPLILVSAPAGYGKSTLISCWLETNDSPSAWLSFDEGDNDLKRFLSYFVAAIQTLHPDALKKSLDLINSPILPSISVLTGSLINELDLIEKNYILVLDDFHLIRQPSVSDILTAFLRYPPRTMNLVLIGRRDPFLPISTLRLRKQVIEIRVQDLRFTAVEAKTYLQKILGSGIDDTDAANWNEKTEGWVTGLRLVALAMQHTDGVGDLKEFSRGPQYVTEYLFNEIFSHQSRTMKRYLLATSILKSFCAPLCKALFEQEAETGLQDLDGWDFIKQLRKENLFVFNLDTENRWFRYHHLFQQLLQNQLKRNSRPEDINRLHSAAGRWFAENDLLEEALEHAIAADDITFATQLVEEHRHTLLNEEQWNRIEHLLRLVPEAVIEKEPELLLMKAWLFQHTHRIQEMFEIINLAKPMIDALPEKMDHGDHMRGEMFTLIANKFNFETNSREAILNSRKALDLLPTQYALVRGQATLINITAHQMNGDRTVIHEIEHNFTADSYSEKPVFYSRKVFAHIYVCWMNADLPGLLKVANHLSEFAQEKSLRESRVNSSHFLGIALYLQNDMVSAEKHFAHSVENIYIAHVFVGIQSCLALSLVYQNQGHTDRARGMVEKAVAFASERQNPYGVMCAKAFEAELSSRQGHLKKACEWARRFNPEPFRSMAWFHVPQLSLANILLAEKTRESLRRASDLLDRLHAFVVSIHNTRFRIDVLALQALLLDIQGDDQAALKKLAGALKLAEPGGFIRNFSDMGPHMADLLERLEKKNIAGNYVRRILAAFKKVEQGTETEQPLPSKSPDSPESVPSVSRSTKPQPLVEPLTNRELDILELIGKRLQNKEIADKLFISTETVKTHLKNIYQKLQAGNRRQAVEKAKKLEIIY